MDYSYKIFVPFRDTYLTVPCEYCCAVMWERLGDTLLNYIAVVGNHKVLGV